MLRPRKKIRLPLRIAPLHATGRPLEVVIAKRHGAVRLRPRQIDISRQSSTRHDRR